MFNSVHPTSWTLRKIKSKGYSFAFNKSLDLSSLRKVDGYKNPYDTHQFRECKKEKSRKTIQDLETQMLEDLKKYAGLSEIQKVIVDQTVSENTKVMRNLRKTLGKYQQDLNEIANPDMSEMNILDQEIGPFPIEDQKLISEKNNSVDNSGIDILDEEDKSDNTLAQKYSTMIDRKVVKVKKETAKKEVDKVSLEEMQITTQELQNWASSILDKPEVLIEDLDPNNPDPDRPTCVPLHETVDIGALDVLLNACKPSLFDSKPPIRLNVVQEVAPPDSLVKNLHKNLGLKVSEKSASKVAKAKGGFGVQKKEVKPRIKYGEWYIRPKEWNEKMKSQKDNAVNMEKTKSSQGLHEMIQKKLADIRANQEKEDAEILAENNMKPGGKRN